jgi:hypothetical protein
MRYNIFSGDFIDTFASGGGLTRPFDLTVGWDLNLYVTSDPNSVLRYNGKTGAFMDTFAVGDGPNNSLRGLTFGPDKNLYVAAHNTRRVLRYNGTTETFLGVFVPPGGRGELPPIENLVFGPDGNL